MSIKTINGLKAEWKPTTFCLANGHTYTVNHPDYLIIAPGNKAIIIFSEPDGDIQAIIDVAQIANIERLT